MISSGLVEDYLKWTNDMWYIIKNKLCASPASKFNTVKCLLAEEDLEEWETTEATVTQKHVIVPALSENPDVWIKSEDQGDQNKSESGTDQELEEQAVEQTNETFKECTKLFLDQRITAGSARKQNTYMRSNLKKQEG